LGNLSQKGFVKALNLKPRSLYSDEEFS